MGQVYQLVGRCQSHGWRDAGCTKEGKHSHHTPLPTLMRSGDPMGLHAAQLSSDADPETTFRPVDYGGPVKAHQFKAAR